MFKIKPWLQSDKWKQRETTKDIYTDIGQLTVKWLGKMSTYSSLPRDYTIPYFKESYTASDLSALSGYQPVSWSAWGSSDLDKYAKFLAQEKYWDPWCKITNWNIEIMEAGTYVVQAFAEYVYPNGYNSSNSYQYRDKVALLEYSNNERWPLNEDQSRCCSNHDEIMTWQISWFEAWKILNVWAAHTYWSQVAVFEYLNVAKLR